jgi:uncharacterized protein YegP (UPF0339 family)
MKFLIRRTINKQFYFILRARNGETIATSETYVTLQGCRKGIRAIRKSLFARTVDETS